MADSGYEVLEFDASIKQSPYPNHPNIKFYKKFVGAQNSHDTISLENIISESKMNPNAHNILQCDIENAEWEIIDKIDIALLAKYFAQVLFEFHECDPRDAQKTQYRIRLLKKLNEFYTPIHTHFNNNGLLHIVPNVQNSESASSQTQKPNVLLWNEVVEVSYIRNDLLPSDFKRASGVYIHPLDKSNDELRVDPIIVF